MHPPTWLLYELSLQTCEVWTIADVDKAAEIVGFPMVVKPASGAGSQGVYRADSVDELRQLVARYVSSIYVARVAAVSCLHTWGVTALANSCLFSNLASLL